MPVENSSADKQQRQLIDLALQGGGSHGAFTWGVLDRLLEESWLTIEAISGTSAGAMTAAVMAAAHASGGNTAARRALQEFWQRVSRAAVLSPLQRSPLDVLLGGWSLDHSPAYIAFDLMARIFSPYDLAFGAANPLARVLADSIDFACLANAPIKLFITATNVRTGRPRVFRNTEMSPDVLLASACLPAMFQAVEIDGEAYWDGGFSGNPTMTPLVQECVSDDTILVAINSVERPGIPRSARDILNRLNEVSFNAVLLKELRMVALLRRVASPDDTEVAHWARMRMHMIRSEMMVQLGSSSKLNAEWAFLNLLRDEGRRARAWWRSGAALNAGYRPPAGRHLMGLAGILLGLALLIWLAFRGWTVLLLAPAAALLAAAFAGEPLLAHWTQTFMGSAAQFIAQFFPIFLMGALFGKLMEDSGSVTAIAQWMIQRLGTGRAVLAVVLAGALVTYGGVSLFVAFFVLAPMAETLFRSAAIPRRLMPAAIALGTSTFTMSALPGTPAIQNAIPMPFFGTTPFAAPGLGLIAAAIMVGFGMWWLTRAGAAARRRGEGFGDAAAAPVAAAAADPMVRERATTAQAFDPAEIHRSRSNQTPPSILAAALPLVVVIAVNLLMSFVILPRLDTMFLAEPRWGATSLSAVGGVWSVAAALAVAILTLLLVSGRRLPSVRASMDAGANAAVLPAFSVASLVGFGAVVAALPAFALVRDWVLGLGGGPLVSLAVATNVLSALTGSASGGLTIALDALGPTYMRLAADHGIDPALLHRVAVIGAGTLDSLPHNGAVVTLLAVCGSTHAESYVDIVMVGIVGALAALAAVIVLGGLFGSF